MSVSILFIILYWVRALPFHRPHPVWITFYYLIKTDPNLTARSVHPLIYSLASVFVGQWKFEFLFLPRKVSGSLPKDSLSSVATSMVVALLKLTRQLWSQLFFYEFLFQVSIHMAWYIGIFRSSAAKQHSGIRCWLAWKASLIFVLLNVMLFILRLTVTWGLNLGADRLSIF